MNEQKNEASTKKPVPRIRVKHEFQEGTGRLLASVASLEISRNEKGQKMLAVGIARANTDLEAKPNELAGSERAKARLSRLLGLTIHRAGGAEMSKEKIHRTEVDISRNLALVMTEEDFVEKILKATPFSQGRECPFGGADTLTKKSRKRRAEAERLGPIQLIEEKPAPIKHVPRTKLPGALDGVSSGTLKRELPISHKPESET